MIGLFVAARLSSKLSTGHYFDYLHWTIAYAIAATLAWMGVRRAGEGDVASRRWFAWGLTITLAAQVLFDLQEITHRTPILNLSDALFLSIGPCFVMGMLAPIRGAHSDAAALIRPQRHGAGVGGSDPDIGFVLAEARPNGSARPDDLDHLSDLHADSSLHWPRDGPDAALDGELSMAAAAHGFAAQRRGLDDLECQLRRGCVDEWLLAQPGVLVARHRDGLRHVCLAHGAERRFSVAAPLRSHRLRLIPLIVVAAGVISLALVWALPVLASVKITTIVGATVVIILATRAPEPVVAGIRSLDRGGTSICASARASWRAATRASPRPTSNC